MNKNIIIIGAGGHTKNITDVIIKSRENIVGYLDDNKPIGCSVLSYPVIGTTDDSSKYLNCEFIIAIGDNYTREKMSNNMLKKYPNLRFYTAIHPKAILGTDIKIGGGTNVMAGAIINASTKIGRHCIIGAGSIIAHDCILDDFVQISPNATLCGGVKIGKSSHIGASATIKQYIEICENSIIGIGAAVVKSITESGVYVGVPAKLK